MGESEENEVRTEEIFDTYGCRVELLRGKGEDTEVMLTVSVEIESTLTPSHLPHDEIVSRNGAPYVRIRVITNSDPQGNAVGLDGELTTCWNTDIEDAIHDVVTSPVAIYGGAYGRAVVHAVRHVASVHGVSVDHAIWSRYLPHGSLLSKSVMVIEPMRDDMMSIVAAMTKRLGGDVAIDLNEIEALRGEFATVSTSLEEACFRIKLEKK